MRRPTRSSGRRGGRTSRHVHWSGSLSGRKRTSFVPWRKRLFSSLSKRTSTTSFGFSACSSSSPVPQRFGSEKRAVALLVEQRQHQRRDLVVALRADRRRADVVEMAVVGVEAEQERRDRRAAARLQAHAGDDAVGRLVRLHLHDAVARAGEVRQAELLRDHAVEAGRLQRLQPLARLLDVVASPARARSPSRPARAARGASRSAARAPACPSRAAGRRRRRSPGSRPASLRTRLSAGCSRVCIASKSSLPVAGDHDLAVERGVRRQELARSRAAPGSSGAAAARSATRARARRRRSRARRGSRPISARTASRPARADPRRARPPSAGTGRSGLARRAQPCEPIGDDAPRRRATVALAALARAAAGRSTTASGRRRVSHGRARRGALTVRFEFRSAPAGGRARYKPAAQLERVRLRAAGAAAGPRVRRRPLPPGGERRAQGREGHADLHGREAAAAAPARCSRRRRPATSRPTSAGGSASSGGCRSTCRATARR